MRKFERPTFLDSKLSDKPVNDHHHNVRILEYASSDLAEKQKQGFVIKQVDASPKVLAALMDCSQQEAVALTVFDIARRLKDKHQFQADFFAETMPDLVVHSDFVIGESAEKKLEPEQAPPNPPTTFLKKILNLPIVSLRRLLPRAPEVEPTPVIDKPREGNIYEIQKKVDYLADVGLGNFFNINRLGGFMSSRLVVSEIMLEIEDGFDQNLPVLLPTICDQLLTFVFEARRLSQEHKKLLDINGRGNLVIDTTGKLRLLDTNQLWDHEMKHPTTGEMVEIDQVKINDRYLVVLEQVALGLRRRYDIKSDTVDG